MASTIEEQKQGEPERLVETVLPVETALSSGISEIDHKKQQDLKGLASALIMSEQTLIHNRMTWMMTFQRLLFASFALTASTTNDERIRGRI